MSFAITATPTSERLAKACRRNAVRLARTASRWSQEQRHVLSFPDAAVLLEADGLAWRVHWVSTAQLQQRGRLLDQRLSLQIPTLAPGRFIDHQLGCWLVYEARHDGSTPWQQTPALEPIAELRTAVGLRALARLALESLHRQSCLWLNFDPNSIEDVGHSNCNAVTWTQSSGAGCAHEPGHELFPFGAMPERVRVHPHYAAPEIVQYRVADIGPRTDTYHLALFAYYGCAALADGLSGSGLEEFDYELPFLRVFAPQCRRASFQSSGAPCR